VKKRNKLKMDLKEIDKIVASIGNSQEKIVSLLHAIQETYNYLPEEALQYLGEITDIPPAIIFGIATFYAQFRFKLRGKHLINVCIGTACHVKGALQLYDDFKRYLEIEAGEDTDKDKLFTVDKVACLGCCMLAPAVQIGDIIYGHVTAESIPNILNDFLELSSMGKIDTDLVVKTDPISGIVKICLCSSCQASGAKEINQEIKRVIMEENLPVKIKNVGCTGISFQTPLMEIETRDQNVFRYGLVQPEDVSEIMLKHFKPKKVSRRITKNIYALLKKLYTDCDRTKVIRYRLNVRDKVNSPYLNCQKQLATQHSGEMNPLDIDEYISRQGFKALKQCILDDNADNVVRIIQESKLRGRGGAGFETARKWKKVKERAEQPKYIICNADEGDPGAFMDRMLLESFPFRVLEGIAIAAFACGIKQGFIFIRAEYPLAIERIKQALKICEERGLLGKNSPVNLELELFVSAGAFVCGEETALIKSIEGERGMPYYRPPYPSEQGFRNKPTLVNNVETFALVPWIILNGAYAFLELGTEKSAGSKTFALAGKVRNGGLIEVEMGTSLREIIYEIGGGISDDKKLKAVQIGGPAGGCLPASLIDTIVDYEHLKDLGTIMGSGGLIVLDEEDCIVDMAHYFMSFTQKESCGKCTFGRVGTKRMLEILEKMTKGEATIGELANLEEIAVVVKKNSLCGLGRAAPNPILSGLKYFRPEFISHLEGKCPAKKCKHLIIFRITDDCIGCTKCAQRCPVDAIKINPYVKHEIDQELCTKCDSCRLICPNGAVVKE